MKMKMGLLTFSITRSFNIATSRTNGWRINLPAMVFAETNIKTFGDS